MRHFINGIEIAPRNLQDIGVKIDFTERPFTLELNVDSIILPREGYDLVKQHIQSQGVFEGIPYEVLMNNGVALQYYIDLTDTSTLYSDFEAVVKIKKRFGKDNFFERADGVTFTSMLKKGVQFDFINTPYVIVPDGKTEILITLGISTFILTKELIQAIRDSSTLIRDFIEAVTPNVSIPPTPPLGEIISLALAVVAQLVYTALVLIALIKLAQQLFELIFPKIRFLLSCKVRELMLKSCQYLGYQFNSTLFQTQYSGLTILPVPLQKQKEKWWQFLENDLNFAFNKGVPTGQDTIITVGDLFRTMELTFNARTRVTNGVVQIERRDFWQNISTANVVPALALQDKRVDQFKFNTEEIWKRAYIHYEVDFSDLHSADDYEGTDAEYSTEPLNVINDDLVSIKGYNDIAIPFALGRRKNELTIIEEIAKAFFKFVDLNVGAFGGNSNYEALIQNRIGVLQVSQQFFSTTKLLYIIGNSGKQPENYLSFIGAPAVYNSQHVINEITNNDYKFYENLRTKITENDFVNLLNNNFVEIEGEDAEILQLEYIDERSLTVISYKQRFDYTTGKVTIETINE
jgi:hypothetical protein